MNHLCQEQGLEAKEEPIPREGSFQKEESGETKPDVQTDDTAPKQEPAKRLYYNAEITGNEGDSVFRKLSECFSDGYHGEWAGFYNQGYPAYSQHRQMFWHVTCRGSMFPHRDHWYSDTDGHLMKEYIARHKDQPPLQDLEELKETIEYGCSDPRLLQDIKNSQKRHPRKQRKEFKMISTI